MSEAPAPPPTKTPWNDVWVAMNELGAALDALDAKLGGAPTPQWVEDLVLTLDEVNMDAGTAANVEAQEQCEQCEGVGWICSSHPVNGQPFFLVCEGCLNVKDLPSP